MNSYLLRFLKEIKSKSLLGSPYKVKKFVSKLNRKYYGTIYLLRDIKHKIRIYIKSEKQENESWPVIFIDREDSFDKFTNCPIKLPAPKNNKEYEKLLVFVRWILLDKAWYNISNEYQTEKWITSYA